MEKELSEVYVDENGKLCGLVENTTLEAVVVGCMTNHLDDYGVTFRGIRKYK